MCGGLLLWPQYGGTTRRPNARGPRRTHAGDGDVREAGRLHGFTWQALAMGAAFSWFHTQCGNDVRCAWDAMHGVARQCRKSRRQFYRFSLGHRFACAARLDQRIECWGDLSGLRGDGNRKRATWISGYWSATAVATGDNYGCFLRADQQVLCFGMKASTGLNHAGMRASGQPVAMSVGSPMNQGFRRARTIAAGPHRACALSTGGSRWKCSFRKRPRETAHGFVFFASVTHSCAAPPPSA
jgi:hypothetical protein